MGLNKTFIKRVFHVILMLLCQIGIGQIMLDSLGYDNLKWNCNEFELIETIDVEYYQRIQEDDSTLKIEYYSEVSGAYFYLSYRFVNNRLKEINELYSIDTLSENYNQFLNFIVIEQMMYEDKFGLPEMFVGSYNNNEVTRNVYEDKDLIIQFMNWDELNLNMINKILTLKN